MRRRNGHFKSRGARFRFRDSRRAGARDRSNARPDRLKASPPARWIAHSHLYSIASTAAGVRSMRILLVEDDPRRPVIGSLTVELLLSLVGDHPESNALCIEPKSDHELKGRTNDTDGEGPVRKPKQPEKQTNIAWRLRAHSACRFLTRGSSSPKLDAHAITSPETVLARKAIFEKCFRRPEGNLDQPIDPAQAGCEVDGSVRHRSDGPVYH